MSHQFKISNFPLEFEINAKKIKGDPDSKGKSEAQIQFEICHWLRTHRFRFWVIDIKGEPRMTKTGFRLLKNANKGFGDLLLCPQGRLTFLEVKKCGGLCSIDQFEKQMEVRKEGGIYEFVTSVREVEAVFKKEFNYGIREKAVS